MTTEPPDILTANAAQFPDKAAVIDDRPGEPIRVMTFAELNAYANRLANGMLDHGVRPGQRVIWCGQNSLELMAMMHAARKAGLTAVPLNYRLSDDESVYVVDNSDAVLVWSDVEYAPMFARIRDDIPQVSEVVVFGGSPLEGQMAEGDLLGADSEPGSVGVQAATMIYTSGTTGKPKGAVKSRLGSVEQLGGLLGLIGYTADDVYLTCGPLYHSGPGGFASIAHVLGNTVVLQHRFDPEDWLRLLDTHRVTTTFSAPTPIRMVVNLPPEVKARYSTDTMRRMVANAAPWPFALKEAYLRDFPEDSLFEVYGSTELGVNTVLRPEDQMRKPGSCGLPAPYVDLMLKDESGNPIAEPHTPGELWVKASSVLDTYHKAEDKFSQEHDEEGWHTVGDVAYFDEEGYYYICDRKKDMIISGGMNIYPAEVEAALEEHPEIFEAAVFGIPSEEWGESVHAVIVPSGEGLNHEEVTAHARRALASYKIPRSIEFVSEIPKTGSNKILKRELRAKFWEGRDNQVGS